MYGRLLVQQRKLDRQISNKKRKIMGRDDTKRFKKCNDASDSKRYTRKRGEGEERGRRVAVKSIKKSKIRFHLNNSL